MYTHTHTQKGEGPKNERGDDDEDMSCGTEWGKLHIPQPPNAVMHVALCEDLKTDDAAKQHSSTHAEKGKPLF